MLNGIGLISFILMFHGELSVNLNPSREVMSLINAQRAKGCRCGKNYFPPQAPLVWNDTIAKAAQGHADYLAASNRLSHRDQKGSMARERLSRVGYSYQSYAENIAEGFFSAEEVVKAWVESPMHCRNLMGKYEETAVGYSKGYWVQNFGTPQKRGQ